MYQYLEKRRSVRINRAFRVRKKLKGSAERPRFCVSKTLRHIGVQIIDDEKGITLVSFSTQSKLAEGQKKSKEGAKFVGQRIAELAKQKNIETVVFDRGCLKYHGLIAELANAAREAGLKF